MFQNSHEWENLKYKVNGKHILLPIYRTFVGHFVRRRDWRCMLHD